MLPPSRWRLFALAGAAAPSKGCQLYDNMPIVIFQFYFNFSTDFLAFVQLKSEGRPPSGGSFSTLDNLCLMAIHVLPVLCGVDKTGNY
jgi:hypothetical protein